MNWRCLLGRHEWKLIHGSLDKITMLANALVVAGTGGHPDGLLLSTAYRRRADGGIDIWAWECSTCGKRKRARAVDVPKEARSEYDTH